MSIDWARFDPQKAIEIGANVAYPDQGIEGDRLFPRTIRTQQIPAPKPLTFTVTDACTALGVEDRGPSTWTELIEHAGWREHAACRDRGNDDFYNDDRQFLGCGVCAGCPVRPECLAYAMNREERHGVWGGLTVELRRSLATNGGTAHGTYAGAKLHRRRKEPLCVPCRDASNAYDREWKRTHRKGQP